MKRWKCVLFELWLKKLKKMATGRNRETTARIVTENNLFKGFTTEGIRNYDQK